MNLCCRWWQVPYYWVGIKVYDIVAGSKCLRSSYFLSKERALEKFPMLRRDKLCGALVYYDGEQTSLKKSAASVRMFPPDLHTEAFLSVVNLS